jgi:hypothetical protein
MERAPKAANGRNSPPEKAEYKPAAATVIGLIAPFCAALLTWPSS